MTILTAEQKQLIEQVARMWAAHQGWPPGRWPRDRRHDAMLITQFVMKLGGPVDFWKAAIAIAPRGARFTWLTTPPTDGVSRLEEWLFNRRETEWAEQKQRFAVDDHTVGTALKRMIQAAPA